MKTSATNYGTERRHSHTNHDHYLSSKEPIHYFICSITSYVFTSISLHSIVTTFRKAGTLNRKKRERKERATKQNKTKQEKSWLPLFTIFHHFITNNILQRESFIKNSHLTSFFSVVTAYETTTTTILSLSSSKQK